MTHHTTDHRSREAALTHYVTWLEAVEFRLNNDGHTVQSAPQEPKKRKRSLVDDLRDSI